MILFVKYAIYKMVKSPPNLFCMVETSDDRKSRPCPWKSMHEKISLSVSIDIWFMKNTRIYDTYT